MTAAPTSGLVDEEREPRHHRIDRRLVAGVLAAAAVVLISVGVALVASPHRNAAGGEAGAGSTKPIAPVLPGTVGLGTWTGTGDQVVTAPAHQVAAGRELAVSVECSGRGPVSVGSVTQPDCSMGAVTESVTRATATRLQVSAPNGSTWRFSLLDEPRSGTSGALVSMPNPVLDIPAAQRAGSGAGTGPSSIDLEAPGNAGPQVSNVRLVLTCKGAGVTLTSDDGSVANDYAHSCMRGWSYEFDVLDVRLPTTLHIAATATTSWNLVAVPF